MNNLEFPSEVVAAIRKDRKVRVATVSASHMWFFHVYFAAYVKYQLAPFHQEMFRITEDESTELAVVMAFRGSAKSTIFSMSFPIWAILGKQQRKSVLLVSQTQKQSRDLLASVRAELEDNELLRSDLGPFEEHEDQWGATSLVLPKYQARITTASIEQSIRGIRHRHNRPDLVIIDDIEDLDSVKTHEGRTKTYERLTGEIFPAGDIGTRFIIVGNYLHEESALARIAKSIDEGARNGVCMRVPLLGENDEIAWPGKYPTMQAVEKDRATMGDRAFQREMMLVSVGVLNEIIKPEWIHKYTELPNEGFDNCHLFSATGVDLAISKESWADYTAMVSAHVYRIDGSIKIFILPNIINAKMDFPETEAVVRRMSSSLWPGVWSRLYIEEVSYQAAIIQSLRNKSYPVTGFKPQGQDKASRLILTTPHLQHATIQFPSSGAEPLIRQLIGFGSEKHDDLADAFAILILLIIQDIEHFDDQQGYIGPRAGTPFDPDFRKPSRRNRYNVVSASDNEFFSSPTGIDM